MFGKNYIAKKEDSDGENLRVVASSPFLTIQGEGPFSGWPAIFLRLHGCHLACTFCDTQFSDESDPTLSKLQIMDKIYELSEAPGYKASRDHLVVITGGEPMRQNIVPLCQFLHSAGYLVQIETAGSFWLPDINYYAKLIVSPKTAMVHDKVRAHARAFKYVVNSETEFDSKGIPIADTQGRDNPRPLAAPANGTDIYLSPMNEYNDAKNKANVATMRDACLKYGYIAGVQLHTILGVD